MTNQFSAIQTSIRQLVNRINTTDREISKLKYAFGIEIDNATKQSSDDATKYEETLAGVIKSMNIIKAQTLDEINRTMSEIKSIPKVDTSTLKQELEQYVCNYVDKCISKLQNTNEEHLDTSSLSQTLENCITQLLSNTTTQIEHINTEVAYSAKDGVKQISDSAKDGVKQISDSVDAGVKQISDSVDAGVQDSAKQIQSTVDAGVKQIQTSVDMCVDAGVKQIQTSVDMCVDAGVKQIQDHVDAGVKQIQDSVTESIKESVKDDVNEIQDSAKISVDTCVQDGVKQISDSVQDGVKQISDSAKISVDTCVKQIQDHVDAGVKQIEKSADTCIQINVKNINTHAQDSVQDGVKQISDSVKKCLEELQDESNEQQLCIQDSVQDGVKQIQTSVQSGVEKVVNTGEAIDKILEEKMNELIKMLEKSAKDNITSCETEAKTKLEEFLADAKQQLTVSEERSSFHFEDLKTIFKNMITDMLKSMFNTYKDEVAEKFKQITREIEEEHQHKQNELPDCEVRVVSYDGVGANTLKLSNVSNIELDNGSISADEHYGIISGDKVIINSIDDNDFIAVIAPSCIYEGNDLVGRYVEYVNVDPDSGIFTVTLRNADITNKAFAIVKRVIQSGVEEVAYKHHLIKLDPSLNYCVITTSGIVAVRVHDEGSESVNLNIGDIIVPNGDGSYTNRVDIKRLRCVEDHCMPKVKVLRVIGDENMVCGIIC